MSEDQQPNSEDEKQEEQAEKEGGLSLMAWQLLHHKQQQKGNAEVPPQKPPANTDQNPPPPSAIKMNPHLDTFQPVKAPVSFVSAGAEKNETLTLKADFAIKPQAPAGQPPKPETPPTPPASEPPKQEAPAQAPAPRTPKGDAAPEEAKGEPASIPPTESAAPAGPEPAPSPETGQVPTAAENPPTPIEQPAAQPVPQSPPAQQPTPLTSAEPEPEPQPQSGQTQAPQVSNPEQPSPEARAESPPTPAPAPAATAPAQEAQHEPPKPTEQRRKGEEIMEPLGTDDGSNQSAALEAIIKAVSLSSSKVLLSEFRRLISSKSITPEAKKDMMEYIYTAGLLSFAGKDITAEAMRKVLQSIEVPPNEEMVKMVMGSGVQGHLVYIYAFYYLLAMGVDPTEDTISSVVRSLGAEPDKTTAAEMLRLCKNVIMEM